MTARHPMGNVETSSATARLFFALWPDATVRAAIDAAARTWQWPEHARRVAAPKLHVTLHFIGDVARERVDVIAAEARVAMQPFVLRLDTASSWPRGVAVLEARTTPQAAVDLHAALGERLRACGIDTETRRWKPHVTLARDAQGATQPAPAAPIDWPVDGYALVESKPGEQASYRVLQRCTAAGSAR